MEDKDRKLTQEELEKASGGAVVFGGRTKAKSQTPCEKCGCYEYWYEEGTVGTYCYDCGERRT